MSNIRKKGVAYLQKLSDYNASTFISVSKLYEPEESWTRKSAWWFDLSIEKVQADENGIYYLVGESQKSRFVVLKVSNKFLIDNLKKFETRYQGRIRLHLSAESSDRFTDKRGKGQVDFSRFELNV